MLACSGFIESNDFDCIGGSMSTSVTIMLKYPTSLVRLIYMYTEKVLELLKRDDFQINPCVLFLTLSCTSV